MKRLSALLCTLLLVFAVAHAGPPTGGSSGGNATRTVVVYFNKGITHSLERGPQFDEAEVRDLAN